MQAINDFALAAAGSPWVFVVVLFFTTVDGFFPPLPSESIVVAAAALLAGQQPWLLLPLAACALAGSWLGDNTAFLIGSRVGTARFRRHPRLIEAFELAERKLQQRAAVMLVTARFIPVVRVAINMTSGAVRFPWRQFRLITVGSGLLWTAWCLGIGTLAGQWAEENPLLAVSVAVVAAFVLGVLLDKVMSHVTRLPSPVAEDSAKTDRI